MNIWIKLKLFILSIIREELGNTYIITYINNIQFYNKSGVKKEVVVK